jgi:hypothetical protein
MRPALFRSRKISPDSPRSTGALLDTVDGASHPVLGAYDSAVPPDQATNERPP